MKDGQLGSDFDSEALVLQEFSQSPESKVDLNNIKLPFTLKDKILMSPGTWNGKYFDANAINETFNNTDFSDKMVNGLYSDHLDGLGIDGEPDERRVTEWIGDVTNVRNIGGTLIGDLNILDMPLAVKLAYGAKFGVSPSVFGMMDRYSDKMLKFRINNFGIVVNPAIKTAFINNSQKKERIEELSQITAMESKRNALGMSVGEFYAMPRDPPSESKLPIFDKPHVQNALARISQVKGVSESEMKSAKSKIRAAAKKFKIEISEEFGDNMEETEKTTVEAAAEQVKEAPKTEAAKAPEPNKEVEGLKAQIAELTKMVSSLATAKKEEPVKAPEPVKEEPKPDPAIAELTKKIAELEKARSDPVRITQETGENKQPVSSGNVDQDMLDYIKGLSK